MNFLKSIKTKALNLANFNNNNQTAQKKQQQQQHAQTNEPKEQTNNLKPNNFQNLVSSIYHKFKEEIKDKDKNKGKEKDYQKQIQKVVVSNNLSQGGIIWCTANTNSNITQDINSNNVDKNKNNIISKQSLPSYQLIEVTPQQCIIFIQNLTASTIAYEKYQKQKIIKARAQIFQNLSIQPIYTQEGFQSKIINMELYQNFDLEVLRERIQVLEKQRLCVEDTIAKVLFSGYLWEGHEMDNRGLFQVGFDIIAKGISHLGVLTNRLYQQRQKIKLFLRYYNKILDLNRKRIKIAKKLKLLTKIKSYQKDISLQATNIDQAFYIQRNRQKVYTSLLVNKSLLQKVHLLQSFKNKLQLQNKKLLTLIQAQILNWIDKGKVLQNKHIQKILILLYFIRNEPMYKDNGLRMQLGKLENKKGFVEKINEVMGWNDYKYVNDPGIKVRVREFLEELSREFGGVTVGKGNMMKKKKYLQVGEINSNNNIDNTKKQVKQVVIDVKNSNDTDMKKQIKSNKNLNTNTVQVVKNRNTNTNNINNTNNNNISNINSKANTNNTNNGVNTTPKISQLLKIEQAKLKQKLQNPIIKF